MDSPGPVMTGRVLRSGQLADVAGVNPQTLRYYERRGLLASPPAAGGPAAAATPPAALAATAPAGRVTSRTVRR
ncbi:MerR family DNA-binding transcriptional regulator [Micromonospora sp. ATCC 39149]|uniref:MerR family DNA-binding transcriptional regulator n=1 Tax=Micromonospora sp. (strain ATCC 39149 / NRRL 15099 / SCC 1413) TaxID=219305 RepID=UPI001E3662DF|nr:MerR family DNA-binding transcriptional regulator [Micromonospora sp. ATCC 39149]